MSDKSGETARCKIPQEVFLSGAMYIVAAYKNDLIIETYKFKHAAKKGAQSLGHDKFADMIQKQIDVLCEAMEINKNKNEGEET